MINVYILKSLKNGRYYIGCTNDLKSRLVKHNNGYVRSTKSFKPWQLVYKEDFNSLSLARKREKQLKSWKKRQAIENLINRGPIV